MLQLRGRGHVPLLLEHVLLLHQVSAGALARRPQTDLPQEEMSGLPPPSFLPLYLSISPVSPSVRWSNTCTCTCVCLFTQTHTHTYCYLCSLTCKTMWTFSSPEHRNFFLSGSCFITLGLHSAFYFYLDKPGDVFLLISVCIILYFSLLKCFGLELVCQTLCYLSVK